MIFIFTCLFLNPLGNVTVCAQTNDANLQETDDNIDTEKAIEEIKKGIAEVQALDNYQINFKITNADKQQLLVTGKMIVDKPSGNMRLLMDLYDYSEVNKLGAKEGTKPEKYEFDMLSYDQFKLVYVNQPKLLFDLGLLNIFTINKEDEEKIKLMTNEYVAINEGELDRLKFNRSIDELLAFVPDENKLDQIEAKHIVKSKQMYFIDLERLEIPNELFTHGAAFNLNYGVDLTGESQDDVNKPYNFDVNQKFDILSDTPGFSINLSAQSELDLLLSNDEFSSIENESIEEENNNESTEIIEPKTQYQMGINSKDVSNKMTFVNLVINPNAKSYVASVVGISETMNLNLFKEETTASFDAANYRFDYDIRPTEEKIPKREDINAMTNREFTYYIENMMNQTKD